MGRAMNDLSSAPRPEGERPKMQRKPDWIRVKAPVSKGYQETRKLMRELNLHTVCEEAACPNIGECWTKKHATVLCVFPACALITPDRCISLAVLARQMWPRRPFVPPHVVHNR